MILLAEHRPIADQELLALVREAKATRRPVDQVVTKRLFDGDPPALWGDWPIEARETWSRAIAAYRALGNVGRGSPAVRREREKDPPDLRRAWLAIEAAGAAAREEYGGTEWWETPYVKWTDLAELVGASPAATIYALRGMGWAFAGNHSTRRVAEAPCMMCGQVHAAPELEDGRCAGCL